MDLLLRTEDALLLEFTQLLQSLCTLYLLTCQVRVTAGNSGLHHCVHVMAFGCSLTPLFVDSTKLRLRIDKHLGFNAPSSVTVQGEQKDG